MLTWHAWNMPRHVEHNTMPRCISVGFLACMGYPGLLFQTVARFWEQLHSALSTQLICSSAYHPQTDGQTERINQILEDML